jgi:hypothetical protein
MDAQTIRLTFSEVEEFSVDIAATSLRVQCLVDEASSTQKVQGALSQRVN